MATATAKTKANSARPTQRATVSNPGGRTYHVNAGNRGKNTNKRGQQQSKSGKAKNRKKNPGTTTTTPRKTYRRNPSPTTNAALFAIGGALVVWGYDTVVNKFLPTVSTPLRIGGAVVGGYAIGRWGKKYLGSWADIAQAALWFKAAWDGWNSYLAPTVNGYLGIGSNLAITGQQQVQSKETGQLGMRLFLSDGNAIDLFEGNAAMA